MWNVDLDNTALRNYRTLQILLRLTEIPHIKLLYICANCRWQVIQYAIFVSTYLVRFTLFLKVQHNINHRTTTSPTGPTPLRTLIPPHTTHRALMAKRRVHLTATRPRRAAVFRRLGEGGKGTEVGEGGETGESFFLDDGVGVTVHF